MRDYGKVHSTFWSSPTTSSMSDDAKMLALYLMTCTHSTIAGVFRLPDGYVAEDLAWPSERVAKGFSELFHKGFANRCETTKWVWICKHLEWNKPENPNQRKSAQKIAQSIPDECVWKRDFMRVCGHFLDLAAAPEANPSETVAEPFLNQKQEQKQKQKSSSPIGDGGKSAEADVADPCPQQEIIALYHRLLPTGRQVREWTPARSQALRARWREKAKRQNLEWWERFFAYVAESDFLTGKVHTPGRKPFELSLDWLVKAENMAKVIEGAYQNAAEEGVAA